MCSDIPPDDATIISGCDYEESMAGAFGSEGIFDMVMDFDSVMLDMRIARSKMCLCKKLSTGFFQLLVG